MEQSTIFVIITPQDFSKALGFYIPCSIKCSISMCSGKAHNRQSYAIIIPQLPMFVSQLVYSWHVSHIISV